MDITTIKFPFYAKFCFILLTLILLVIIFFYGQSVIVPLLMSLLFAILLRPVVKFLNLKLHLPLVIATIISVLVFCTIFVGIFYYISIQIGEMANDWGKIQRNVQIHLHNLQGLVRENFNLSNSEQKKMIDDATKDSMTTGKALVSTTIVSFTDVFMNLILIPIYMFLILLYRNHFIKFLSKLINVQYHTKLRAIMGSVKSSVQSYIVGLLIEMVVVSVLTAVGFMFIGLKYAILLGVITGILNLIPYIGIVIAGLLSVIASLTGSADLSIVIGILVVNVVVQLVDNNLLVPMIVSSKVQINALVSIVGIIIGGAIAGFSGMFLAIPLIAIIKVIFDRVDGLEAWGYLLGDDLPKTYEWRGIKLNSFGNNSTDTFNISPDVNVPIYTETSTREDQK